MFSLLALLLASAYVQDSPDFVLARPPSEEQLRVSIHNLKMSGLLVGYPDGIHSPPKPSRYEVAIASWATSRHFERGLERLSAKKTTNAEEVEYQRQDYWGMAQCVQDLEVLYLASIREMEEISTWKRRGLEEFHDVAPRIVRISATLESKGFRCQHFESPVFSDVPSGHWAEKATYELARVRILEGYPDGRFRG